MKIIIVGVIFAIVIAVYYLVSVVCTAIAGVIALAVGSYLICKFVILTEED